MKPSIHQLAATAGLTVLLLTGCSPQPSAAPAASSSASATADTSATATPAPTPSASTTPLGNGSIDAATLDKAFLAGARKAVPAGPDDATMISIGRGICTDLAAGLSSQAALDKVKAHGLTQTDALILLFAAKTVYCSTVK